jgi:hypothetical protein
MSNAGKHMLNWRRDFPALRTALGLLGREGYTSMLVARFLITHSAMSKVHGAMKSIGRELNADTVQSRLKQINEIDWIKQNNPEAYRRGERLKSSLLVDVQRAGLTPFGKLG